MHDNLNLPKNIKLNIKAILEVSQLPSDLDGEINIYKPIQGFLLSGHYGDDDYGGFPFGVRAISGRPIKENAVIESLPYVQNFSQTELMNSNMKLGKSDGLFISFPINKNTETNTLGGGNRKRYVYFDPFIKTFSRDFGVQMFYAETKTVSVGKNIHASVPSTFKHLKYNVSIDIPAKDLIEARDNCAKIQYLCRMFFKENYADDITAAIARINTFSNSINTEEYGETSPDELGANNISDFVKKNGRFVKVYLPGYIEKPNAAQRPPSNFSGKYNNSLDLAIMDLSFDMDMDMGFFENEGNLYPKSITLNLTMVSSNGDLIKNYQIEDFDATSETGKYKIEESGDPNVAGFEHLFPFNRKTVRFWG